MFGAKPQVGLINPHTKLAKQNTVQPTMGAPKEGRKMQKAMAI